MPEQPENHPRPADVADALELDELDSVSGGGTNNCTNQCQGNIAPTCGGVTI